VKEELEKLRDEVITSISRASTEKELSEIRVGVLGRKGSLTQLLKQLGTLSEAERREVGKLANLVKESTEAKIEEALSGIQERERSAALEKEKIRCDPPGQAGSCREEASSHFRSLMKSSTFSPALGSRLPKGPK